VSVHACTQAHAAPAPTKAEGVACERGGLDIYSACTCERAGVSSGYDDRGNERVARTSTSTSTRKQTAEHDRACGACTAHSPRITHDDAVDRCVGGRPSRVSVRLAYIIHGDWGIYQECLSGVCVDDIYRPEACSEVDARSLVLGSETHAPASHGFRMPDVKSSHTHVLIAVTLHCPPPSSPWTITHDL
jgi:hypothetical protein